VNENIQKLYTLSLIDADVSEKQDQIDREIPGRLETAKAEWMEVQQQWEVKQSGWDEGEKGRRDKEAQLKESEEIIKNKEARLYEIKTNKEYQAALHEISEARKVNKTLEDDILAALETFEALKKDVNEFKQKAETRKGEFETIQKQLEEETQILKTTIEGEIKKRESIEKEVDEELLKKYNHVRGARSVAIAYVDAGICQSCFMKVPPQLFNQILKGNDIHFCPTCHKILFQIELKKADEQAS
jgi:uncharacterized protein